MLFLASLLGGVGVLVLHLTIGLGGPHTNELFDDYVYNALMFGAASAVIVPAAVGAAVASVRAATPAPEAGTPPRPATVTPTVLPAPTDR